jgi:phosphatidylglycerophosphatase A
MKDAKDESAANPTVGRGGRRIAAWQGWLLRVFGTSFGLAYIPVARGTFGTLPAVALYALIALTAPRHLQMPLLAIALVVSSALTVVLGYWAETYWGRKDPWKMTLDEFAGYILTVLLFHACFGVPLPREPRSLWPVGLCAFVTTRAMDIVKPPPARRLERLPGGWGILLDDLMSSVYAAALVGIIHAVWPQ